MDHAFKGTRFPWTKQRMEFILTELITKHKKYKSYTRLVEVYIVLAEKIGATPRIVENFIKNLGRDYREWMKMHPDCDRETMTLRGSNKIFKLFEEYNRIYLREDPPNYPQPKLSEYTLDDQDRLVHLAEDEDNDSPECYEEIEGEVKEEPNETPESLKIMSVMSMSSQVTSSCSDIDEPPSPIPPSPPLPRIPKPQGRRSMSTLQASSSASALMQQEPLSLQDVASVAVDMAQAAKLKHVPSGSSGATHGHAHSPIPTNASAANQAVLSTISSLPSPHHPQFHIPQGSSSSAGIGSQYIPLHVIQNGSTNPATFTDHQHSASSEMPSCIPGTSNKRPMKTQRDTQQHSSKKSRASSMPLVGENLPDGMTEFERRYLQSMDTQNKMLSDIGRELKLLRTGFFAIHSDEIADMVNPNMH